MCKTNKSAQTFLISRSTELHTDRCFILTLRRVKLVLTDSCKIWKYPIFNKKIYEAVLKAGENTDLPLKSYATEHQCLTRLQKREIKCA